MSRETLYVLLGGGMGCSVTAGTWQAGVQPHQFSHWIQRTTMAEQKAKDCNSFTSDSLSNGGNLKWSA